MSANLNIRTLVDKVLSAATVAAVPERTLGHEPKGAPGQGLTVAGWVQDMVPVPGASGLGSISVRIVLLLRIYTGFAATPVSEIDPRMVDATSSIFAILASNFQIDLEGVTEGEGRVMSIDILGAYGEPLRALAGYAEMDNRIFRTIDIMVPVIISNQYDLSG